MQSEHQPWFLQTFSKGANTSSDKELTGAKEGSGEYIISRNGRPTSTTGHTGSHEKINGEQLKWIRNIVGSYRCIGSASVNGNAVEFWASTNPGSEFPFCRVNGTVVMLSSLLPITYNNPLQIDVSEDTVGGEVFITDNVPPVSGVGTPMIFNIQDMIDSLTTDPTKYFAAFEPEAYSVNLFIALDMPVFSETVNVGGGGGLPVGSYAYQLRYSNLAGDKTNISQRTPQIPILENLGVQSDQYPGIKTYGQDSNPDFGTRYGIKLRFRVTNLQGYDYIEIIRTAYNSNGGINFVPSPVVVAKIGISINEISVREFIDPVESNTNIALSATDVSNELTYINAAKAIRYFSRRVALMNVTVASKESQLTFEKLNGKEMFPVIDNIGTIGFNDPYNFVYRKAYMHGERDSFAVSLYDGVGGKGFATKIPDGQDYLIPNRRETISAETALYSYGGTVRATSIDNSVQQTHEVFDLTNATYKTDEGSFKNIYHNRIASHFIGIKKNLGPSSVTWNFTETNAQIETHGAEVYALVNVSPFYHPYTPVRQNDPDVSGHNYQVNVEVAANAGLSVLAGPPLYPTQPSTRDFYNPKLFPPTYYSQGMALTGVDNFPSWAKAFSVVRTDSAKRVIAQGIGMWNMIPAEFNKVLPTNAKLTTKLTDEFWFFSPDIENGIVSGKLIDDIIASPESYSLQFVSPLGFGSEVYSFDNHDLYGRDRNVDIIAYARMLRDNLNTGSQGEINPMEDSGMGFVDGSYNYVGFGKWRNRTSSPGLFAGGDKGNNVFDIASAQRISEGRGTYMNIRMNGASLYANPTTGGTGNNNFEDLGMANFTEPFYIVNIIANGAIVRDQNIENYKITTHYQKLESIIGQGNGTLGQKFILVDERWEDVISALDSSWATASTPRYIYIKKAITAAVQKWVNVTYLSGANIATIALAISTLGSYTGPFGTGVQGMYRHENIDGKGRFFNIVFSVPGFYPMDKDLVIIKYDKTAPIRFWGGDTVIGESIFAPIDRECSANGAGMVSSITEHAPETQFPFGIGFPYRLWKMNPRIYQIKRTKVGLPSVIQDRCWGYLGYIRQMCIMFTSESRVAMPYAHDNDYPLQFFPSVNYVMRPHRWDSDLNLHDNNIYPDYALDYGNDEINQWKWGGLRFRQNINADYSTSPPKEFVSKPEFGFVEKVHFPSRVMWSLPRQINSQDVPGLKSFPANNSFDIDDKQGEIKRAWEATTDKGENLYSITDRGICLLVTQKSILSDVGAGQIAYMSADTFVKQQYWINKEVGMSDEMWRGAAEGYVPVALEDGSEMRIEALFFPNNESVFRFMNNQVKDIGRIDYHNTIYTKILSHILPGFRTHITGVFDKYNQEYWLHINTAYHSDPQPGDVVRTEMFSQKNDRWIGYNDYQFDRFLSVGIKTYGMRNVQTLELGIGFLINNATIQYELTGVAAPKPFAAKEFIRVRINTGEDTKPTSMLFYNKYEGPVIAQIDSSLGPLYFKKYNGMEAFIGRMLVSYSPQRYRVQGRSVIWTVTHSVQEDFRIIDLGIMYKLLK